MNFLGSPLPDGLARGPCDVKTVAGDVTERIVSRLLGARPWSWDMPAFRIPETVATETDGSRYGLRPDLWWGKRTAVVEVKAGIARFYVTQRQWESYLWLRDRSSGTPVDRPRIYYAFVGYKLPKASRKYASKHEIVRDILGSIEYVVVADSRLVADLISKSGSYDSDSVTPLSPLLGSWDSYHRVTKARVREWATDPRAMLSASGRNRWRAPTLKGAYRRMLKELKPWGQFDVVPCHVIHPSRPARVWAGPLPGEQTSMLGPNGQPLEEWKWDDDAPLF